MYQKKKRAYEVPQVTEFVCKIEKGFAGSGTGEMSNGFGASRSSYGDGTDGGSEYLWN